MNKNFVLTVFLVAFISVAIYSFTVTSPSSEDPSKLKFNSAVCIYKNDVLVGECSHNTMMNIGLNWTMDKLFGTATTSGNPTVIALGNFTSAETATLVMINNSVTNTAIPDCGLDPHAGTATRLGATNANVSVTYVWTSSCANEVVNTTALYNQTANGTTLAMFSGKNFANSVTLQSGDQLNVTWYVWAS